MSCMWVAFLSVLQAMSTFLRNGAVDVVHVKTIKSVKNLIWKVARMFEHSNWRGYYCFAKICTCVFAERARHSQLIIQAILDALHISATALSGKSLENWSLGSNIVTYIALQRRWISHIASLPWRKKFSYTFIGWVKWKSWFMLILGKLKL